jgi:hypothetical protein
MSVGVVIMAFDLFVWRWASGKEGADPAEVVEALNEDNPHPALTWFDRDAFEREVGARFGDVNDDPDGPFLYEVSDFKGRHANWISFSVQWSCVDDVCQDLIAIAKSQGLAVYDPQEGMML